MNTAARIESTGQKNRVHVSKETAEILKKAGKTAWLTPREDKVMAKGKSEVSQQPRDKFFCFLHDPHPTITALRKTGKGELETYWLNVTAGGTARGSTESTETSTTTSDSAESPEVSPEKIDRLVEWNVEILASFLKEVVKQRNSTGVFSSEFDDRELFENSSSFDGQHDMFSEVVEIIRLPQYSTLSRKKVSGETGEPQLSKEVMTQLRQYIVAIANMYRDNPFHNFGKFWLTLK